MLEFLRPDIATLAGTWQGRGRGDYPTIATFDYEETLTFKQIPGKPFLVYTQKTVGPNGPMHSESGFLRRGEPGRVEFTIAQPTGQTELLEGVIKRDKQDIVLDFRRSTVTNSSTAKRVDQTQRIYHLSGDSLYTEFHMAAVNEPMQQHLASELRRSSHK
ncbi:FABP family protein [Corynebacterium sp. H128]|uniref:FABP family protein n=1 Tax=unclassified Corynebacterium TaxID=2624378 RepID=UPI0030AB6D65